MVTLLSYTINVQISRLSVLAKVFESLINEQLKHFLTENSILNPTQLDFRQGHSTVTAVTSVTNDIMNALYKKSCAAIMINLSKAFDAVDHHLLLQRLQCIGFSSTVLRWFANYLSGSTQCVMLDKCTSSSLEVTMGVLQGSFLGPILFFISFFGSKFVLNAKKTKTVLCSRSPVNLTVSAQGVIESVSSYKY